MRGLKRLLRRCSTPWCWRHGKYKRTRFLGSIRGTHRSTVEAIFYKCNKNRRS